MRLADRPRHAPIAPAQPRAGVRRRRVRAGLIALAVGHWATVALASSEYPGLVTDELDMPCAPTCTLCHRDQSGGLGTVVVAAGGRPFGDAMMRTGGLRGASPELVVPALQAVEAAGVDSDGDGVGDVAELREGRDPNLAGDGPVCPIQYGCGARVAASDVSDTDRWAGLAAAIVGAWLVARRGRRAT